MFQEVKIEFDGSFQCRLATDPAPSAASVSHPSDITAPATYTSPGDGWTFAYLEAPFDRIIRLSNPVQLRSALVDAWKDTTVKAVLVDDGAGLVTVPMDGLVGAQVSLGSGVHFSGVMTQEEMTNFSLAIGGSSFTANQQIPGRKLSVSVDATLAATYNSTKTARIAAAAAIDPVRRQVLATRLAAYASFFGFIGRYQDIPLASVSIPMVLPAVWVLSQISAHDYDWTADISFRRFDGDTLTGNIVGSIRAVKI